ncbi:MAG TPA: 3-deoxy-manno-octulosonate cytidylyltransferase [Phycisphaerales bacterium]|nr:3-deoxy-manno-octulosonate cytidylyltransferase [Phycisphaerales bacterium]
MAVVGVIPARLGSTRLPGKVLLDRTGRPLVRHVWENAARAASLSRLVIAADDERVLAAARGFGAEALMTRPDHPNGTSRIEEAARALGLRDDDAVVNIQGDEPEIDPGLIDAAAERLLAGGVRAATVASPFNPGEDPSDPAVVKVVLRRDGTALYFSRSVLPFARVPGVPGAEPLRHVGLYAYRAGFLREYVRLAPTPLERAESLEQLRVLEHGFAIGVAVRQSAAGGIDTPEQYEAFVQRQAERRTNEKRE